MNIGHKSQGVQQQFSGCCEHQIGLCLNFYESTFFSSFCARVRHIKTTYIKRAPI